MPRGRHTIRSTTSSGWYEDTEGAAALHGFWVDLEFNPEQRAFYYLRVLQFPTPRHTLYPDIAVSPMTVDEDAVTLEIDPNQTGQPPTIQKRACTSPIWYTP
jgi:hypothetical protein